MTRSQSLALTLAIPVVLLAAAQLVPYGRDRTNPPDGVLATFDSPATRQLAERACFDCHSNRTKWPWYASMAPVSWRIHGHVRAGREKLNFTAFDAGNEDVREAAGEAAETVTKGEMPPSDYLLMHPEARLNGAERAALARGLESMFAPYADSEGGSGESRTRTAVERGAARGATAHDESSGHERDGHDGDRD